MPDQGAASWLRLIQGDALTVLRTFQADSLNCVVTSPPYWGLRDYGVEGQIGLEATPEQYVATMVGVFREVRRVLRDDGTLWLNMGDSYATGTATPSKPSAKNDVGYWNNADQIGRSRIDGRQAGLKAKDLIGIPWRVAFALQADSWYLRSDIIWSKPNPMPESVTDRPTKAHEYLFLLSKRERYYYDADAIRTPLRPKTFTTFGIPHHPQGNDALGNVKSDNWGSTVAARHPKLKVSGGWDQGPGAHGTIHRNGRTEATYQEKELIAGANTRSVWEIATEPYPEAHFATFPKALVKPCILAGCPEGGTVLDPFVGSGTTCLVANELGRRSIGIDLNADYLELARKRCEQTTVWEAIASSPSNS